MPSHVRIPLFEDISLLFVFVYPASLYLVGPCGRWTLVTMSFRFLPCTIPFQLALLFSTMQERYMYEYKEIQRNHTLLQLCPLFCAVQRHSPWRSRHDWRFRRLLHLGRRFRHHDNVPCHSDGRASEESSRLKAGDLMDES